MLFILNLIKLVNGLQALLLFHPEIIKIAS